MLLTQDKYLPMQTVAGILGVTERFVYDLIAGGYLTAIKVGSRAVRISEKSLNDYIASRIINPEDLFDPDAAKKEDHISARPPQQPVAKSKWIAR